jgi:hypothetical protein
VAARRAISPNEQRSPFIAVPFEQKGWAEHGGTQAAGGREASSPAARGASGSGRSDQEPRRGRPRQGSELASYWTSSGERLLICALGKRGLEILDIAADFLGPTYRVEQALDDEEALWAVVEDYLAQAKRLDAPPMSGEALAAVMLRQSED